MPPYLDRDDRVEMADELVAVFAAGGDWVTVLHDWRTTAEELADPVRRAILLGDLDTDAYEEVARPE